MNYRNISITLLMLAAFITIVAELKKDDGELKLESLLAISVVLGFALMVPLWGFVLSVPIFLLVYLRNYSYLADLWSDLKNKKLSIGGNE